MRFFVASSSSSSLLLALSSLPSAVQAQQQQQQQSLYDWFVSTNTAAEALVQSAGLVDLLSDTSDEQASLTLLAPTTDSFLSINSRVREYLADPSHADVLADILAGHVLPGNLTAADLRSMNGQNVTFMNDFITQVVVKDSDGGDAVAQQQEGGVITIGGVTVVEEDAIYASNGMGHSINRVLGIVSLMDMISQIASSGALPVSISSLIETFQGSEALESQIEEAQLTLLAPNTAAFLIFGFSYRDFAEAMQEPEWYIHTASLLAKHLTHNAVLMQEDFVDGVELSMLNSEKIYVESDGTVAPEDGGTFAVYPSADQKATALATVEQADILAYEGVIHMIDRVLLPAFIELSVMDVVRRENPQLGALFDLVPDVRARLESDFGVTVFLPSVDAIANMDSTVLEYLQSPEGSQTLTDILEYHVVPYNVPTTSMDQDLVMNTIHGTEKLTIERQGRDILVQGNEDVSISMVTENRLAKNGLVHVMDAVLLPGPLPTDIPDEAIDTDTEEDTKSGGSTGGTSGASSRHGLFLVTTTVMVAIMTTWVSVL